jgi:Spy/CpxP family protein refolding chaperone
MFAHLVLGAFIGAAAIRFAARRRYGFGGGCGRGFHGRGFYGHGFHHRGRHFFGLVRDLGLSREQVAGLKEVWLSGRGAVAAVRASGAQGLHALYEAATSEPLDRARLDEAARAHGAESAKAAVTLAEAVARAHEILTPEQRAKVREHLGRAGGGGAPGWRGDGPYRV